MSAGLSRLAVPTLAAALAGALVIASVALPARAQTQPTCIKRADLLRQLASKFSEKPIAAGIADNGMLLEVYASLKGETWTVAMTLPNGVTCLVASGQEWQMIPVVLEFGPPA